jgi:hypothetical protein
MPPGGEHRHRDGQIARLRAQGHPVSLIAQTFDLTQRHVRRILRARPGESRAFFEGDPEERLLHLLEMHDSVIEDAAMEALNANSHSQRIRALALKVRAIDKKKQLLDEFGLLPHFEPPTLDQAVELGAGFIALLRKHGASSAAIEDELYEVLEAWRTGRLMRYPFEPIENAA